MNKQLIGHEVQKILMKGLGSDNIRIIEKAFQKENLFFNQLTVSDIPKITPIITNELRGEIGFHQRQTLTKLIQKIKPVHELQRIKELPDTDINRRREIDLIVEIGRFEKDSDDTEAAISSFKLAKQKADWIKYTEKKIEALIELAQVQMVQNQWDPATKNIESALELLSQTPNPLNEVNALMCLSRVMWQKGEYEETNRYLDDGLKIAMKHNFKENIGLLLNSRGTLNNHLGNFDKSRESYKKAIPYFEEMHLQQHLAMIYNNLGDTYLQEEIPKKAIKYLELGKQYADQIHFEKWGAWSLFNMGEALAMDGDADGCIKACEDALLVLEHLNDQIGCSGAYRNMALGYSLKEEWDKVDEYINKGYKILKEAKIPHRDGYFNYEWGRIEIHRGDLKLAREKLELALKTFEDLGASLFIEKINRALTELEKAESTEDA